MGFQHWWLLGSNGTLSIGPIYTQIHCILDGGTSKFVATLEKLHSINKFYQLHGEFSFKYYKQHAEEISAFFTQMNLKHKL